MGADEIESGGGAARLEFVDREAIDGSVSDDGVVSLSWASEGAEEVVLQQSRTRDFSEMVERYRGTDPGSVLTGLEEGDHYFRIGNGSGAWSEPLHVTVTFFPRERLFVILALGGVVVLATVIAIVAGFFQNRREGEEK